VVVTTNGHSTEPVKVHAGTAAPAFFQWGASQYALPTRYPDNARVANPSLGAGFVAAKPGDILTLWGTGFGPTDPAQDPSVLTIGTHNVSLKLTVTVGGTPARIVGAALSPGPPVGVMYTRRYRTSASGKRRRVLSARPTSIFRS
jgi:uncharacterized protein (TIGR03437 family)